MCWTAPINQQLLAPITSGVISALIAAFLLLISYAFIRVSRIKRAIEAVDDGLVAIVSKSTDKDDERRLEILDLLAILDRELERVDEGVLSVGVSKELALKRLIRRIGEWRANLQHVDLKIRLRFALAIRVAPDSPEYKDFKRFLSDMRSFADNLHWWSLFRG